MLKLLIYISLSEHFKIKHVDKESFICLGLNGFKKVLVECKDRKLATEFGTVIINQGVGFIYPLGKSKVWNTSKNWSIEIKKKHGRRNQLFSIVYFGPDSYMIINQRACLTFESPNYVLRKCNMTNDQLFTIVYNEKEVDSMTETKNISSKSFAMGSTVDKLLKMIEDNKEIAKNMAKTHKYMAKERDKPETPFANQNLLPKTIH